MAFNIPVVLLIFRRDKVTQIIDRLREIQASKVYLMADYGRNKNEIEQAEACRKAAEQAIDWNCEVIKNYATENRGVYGNIGKGAQWVFQREEMAIFLEDDNLPEVTFFRYCEELLYKYRDNEQILWICGTNYLGKYNSRNGDSYMFTQHLLPCGWASWSSKFMKYYDLDLKLCDDRKNFNEMKGRFVNAQLYYQYMYRWLAERRRIKENGRSRSWDYQMDFALKYHNLYGISPANNQIRNIGVDDISEHGGTTTMNEMTRRFCTMPSYPITFPMKHPDKVEVDKEYENKIGDILLFPRKQRYKYFISSFLRDKFNLPDKPLKEILLGK